MNHLVEILDKMDQALKYNNFKRSTALEELKKSQDNDPFKILIGTIMSSRTRDEKTTEAIRNLFSKYKGPKEIAEADVNDIKKLIYPVGFYNVKAERIKQVAGIIYKNYNGIVPDNIDNLTDLPGVGRKTANCVLVYGFNKPAIPVDIHVHRIVNRIGVIKSKDPLDTEKQLTKLLDKNNWINLNSILVRYGQNICTPQNPKCNYCPLKQECDFYKKNKKEKLKNRDIKTRGL